MWYVGLDLGQSTDYSALAVLEKVQPPPIEPEVYRTRDLFENGMPKASGQVQPWQYHCRHLERFPLGTSYTQIVRDVQARLESPALAGATLVVDATGDGRPVVDMLYEAGMKPVPITIVAGATVSYVDGYFHVPKRDLVGHLQKLLAREQLKIARQLPQADTLVRELSNFQYKLTAAANDTYGAWREGTHDDLVLALAVAIWFAERPVAPPRTPPVSFISQW